MTTTTETTLCPAWCTHHKQFESAADSWHESGYLDIAGALVNMSDGTINGDIRIFGLSDLGSTGPGGESITIEEAEKLAVMLLGLATAARAGRK